jgi:hypothetical protein
MRRRLIQLGLFILAGAIVNVAVAWGCAAFSQADSRMLDDAEAEHVMRRYVPFDARAYDITQVQGAQREGWGWKMSTVLLHQGNFTAEAAPTTLLMTYDAGCPALALRCALAAGSHRVALARLAIPETLLRYPNERRVLPLHPTWPGFAINTLFYATILWVLFAAPFALRRRWRVKRCLCPACAYPIGESDVCTECGKTVKPCGVVSASGSQAIARMEA